MIIVLPFLIIIVYFLYKIFENLSKFDDAINKANDRKNVFEKENNELAEKWNGKIETDNPEVMAKSKYNAVIIQLYNKGILQLLQDCINNIEGSKTIEDWFQINYIYPCYLNSAGDETDGTNNVLFIIYLEYYYFNEKKEKITKDGYFKATGKKSSIKISKVILDDVNEYNIDLDKIEKTKKKFLEIYKIESVNSIILEYKNDSTKIFCNNIEIQNLNQNIQSQKNAKMTAIVGGIAASAATWKAMDRRKKK